MSNLLEKASILTTPTATNDGKLLSVKGGTPADFDFTRGSTATRINSSGLIESVASGLPRIDYKDNSKGALLLEPSRTNLISYSEDFGQWSSNGGGVTSNQTVSPDGTLNADKLFALTNNGQHRVDFYSSNASGATTFSFFAKSAEYNSVWARIGLSTCHFNLENGEFRDNTTDTTSSMKYYGNGWYRCIITKEISNANEVCRINLTQYYRDSSAWTGDGTSGIYVWGAMHEFGSYVTSHIPTNGSTVTRLAETLNNAGSSDLINSTEGVLYSEFYLDANNTEKWISLSDGTSTNRIIIYATSANTFRVYVQNSNGGQVDFASSFTFGQYNKVAFKYKQNDFSLFINSVKVGADTNGGVPSGLDRLNFSDANGTTNSFIGNVKCVAVFKEALTDDELTCLTTI